MSKFAKRKGFKLRLNKIKIQDVPEDSDKCPESGLQTRKHTPMHKVAPFLYMSGYKAAKNPQTLQASGIGHVVNLTAHKCPNLNPDLVSYSSFKFSDHANFNLVDKLDRVMEIIRNKVQMQENVLVHCQMGISRAPSVVIAYLIKFQGMDYNSALSLVQQKNPDAYPNLGFLMQLQTL